jgi:PIN domain nuclease of toxin-antitoxin system
MRLLLDSHLLLWGANEPDRLTRSLQTTLEDSANQVVFSVVSIWEIAIKHGQRRADFEADPRVMRRGLLDNGYDELDVSGQHALAVADLPPIHRDPFDRLLIAQATVEGITLMTTDATVARYPGPIRLV